MKEATWNASIVSDAVRNGDLKTLRWFFDRGCPTDLALNQNGDTTLLIACRLGLLDVARLALLYNARNDPHPDYGNTALQHAVSSGHGSIVELILDCAAPSGLDEVIVNHTDANGEAPIHVASRCGSIDILTLLMMHGANVGVVDARGRTCLHLAAQQGQVACLLCVLEVGGDEFMEVRDDEGWKCLDLSIRANNMECVQVLLQTGAKVSADAIELATKKPKILKLLLEYTADTDGSIDTEEDESISLDESSRGGTIFSGLDTFIASPELKQFRTPMSTEDKIDREEEEEMDTERDHQFSQNDETWTIYFTEDGYRYFYNTDRDYSTWDDPRSKRVLFGQQQTQSAKKLPPASPCVHLSSGSGHTHKEVRVKPTTIAKPFLPEKEVPPEETKITNPLEAAASDPKSILLAQIRTRRDKTASSSEPLAADDMKSNIPSPKREHQEVKPTTIAKSLSEKEAPPEKPEVINPLAAATSDPKSILFAQIRSRRNKESSSSESSTDDMKSNNPNPKREQPEVNPTDPKSILLAQIKARERKSTDKEIDTSKPGMKADTASNDALLKYRKMKTVGVPLPAIVQRMSRDGVCDSAIQMFQQQMTKGDESTLPSQPQLSCTNTDPSNEVVVTAPAKSTTQQKDDLLKDKSLLKYVQMKKVGVPVAAVAMKMSQDGIDDKKINSFRVAYGLDSSGKKTPKQLPAPPHRRSSKAMQKVHVSTIKEEKLRNSLWALSSQIDAEISQKEVEELESLFSASPRPSAKTAIGSKRGKGVRPAKQSSAMIIESKRANNLAISLAQYRAFSNFDDLVTAVVSLDESNLNAEKLCNMQSLLPTTSELNQLKQLNGQVDGLGRAELFFLAVAKMKLFKEKLFSFCYLLQFDDQMKTLTTSLLTLEKACTEVITSKPLAFVCKKLLKIGNLMNGQSATGITLNSLINIAKKKGGSGGKISVIDHLISTSDNCDAMSFKHDMPTLREGTRLDLGEIKLSLRELESGLKSIDSTIKAEQSLMDSQDERPKHSVDFLSRITPFQQRAVQELKTMTDLIERVTSRVDELKRFFAEEPTSTSASIFEALLEFSFIVETSKEAHHRKQRALRRRDSMQRPRTAHM